MFVRKKRNKSGSVSIQIIQKVGRVNKLIQTVGSSKDTLWIDTLFKEKGKSGDKQVASEEDIAKHFPTVDASEFEDDGYDGDEE